MHLMYLPAYSLISHDVYDKCHFQAKTCICMRIQVRANRQDRHPNGLRGAERQVEGFEPGGTWLLGHIIGRCHVCWSLKADGRGMSVESFYWGWIAIEP